MIKIKLNQCENYTKYGMQNHRRNHEYNSGLTAHLCKPAALVCKV